jgi:hypothetical protein
MRHARWGCLGLLIASGFVCGAGIATSHAAEKDAAPAKPLELTSARIQLAILLDTSNSMDGLINQARTQIWKIVNTLATAKRDGKSPDLQVALYEYGKATLPKEQNHLRKILPFTDDLDRISEELFALTTNGGEEYCGAVIDAATRELDWTAGDADLKLVYVCGNEPFTQGSIDYRKACEAAVKRGIIINTIFCGNESEGIRTGWKDGAQLADGSFLTIDQNRVVAEVKTPFDEDLNKLSTAVNGTYVAFGRRNEQEAFRARQAAQDKNAASATPAAGAERAAFKGSAKYNNASSDLVDGVASGKVKLAEVKEDELPEELKSLKPAERPAYLEKKQAERKKIQDEIKGLSEKRNKFIADERAKQAKSDANDSLDAALIKSIKDQAAKRKYEF